MSSEKSEIITLLHTLKPKNIALAQQLAEQNNIDINNEIQDVLELAYWLAVHGYYEDFCCDMCSPSLDEYLADYYFQDTLEERYTQLERDIQKWRINITSGFHKVPKLLHLCTEIEKLNLYNVDFPTVFYRTNHFTKLVELNIYNCTWSSLYPMFATSLEYVENIWIENSTIGADAMEEIFKLPRLRRVELVGNQPMNLADLGEVKNLEYLSIKRQNVHLPTSLGALKQLKTLIINDTNIEQLPEDIGSLTSLERLDIENNRLSTLPKSFKHLNLLVKYGLSLKGNNFSALPDILGEMSRVRSVNLVDNPYQIAEDTSLQMQKLGLEKVVVSRGGALKTEVRAFKIGKVG